MLNRAQEVRENGATSGAGLLAVYTYDNLQRRTSVTFGNGTAETFAYDTDSRDWSLTQNLASTSQDVTLAFTLSPAPQILTRDLSNSAYGYTPPTLAKSYTANGLNQYTEVGGATFTSDTRGNLTSDGSRTFSYDLENHLTSVGGSASMTLAYDPLGRLRETVAGSGTTQFLYDGDRLVAEYDGSNTLLRRYAHGPSVDEPLVWYEGASLTDRRTHHADNQGSIIATSNGSGVGTIQTYGPYGEPSNWSGSRFKYTGQIAIPEISLYHYKARVYDPIVGRLLQTDPVGYDDQIHLYTYVQNDPLNSADPSGMVPVWTEVVRPDIEQQRWRQRAAQLHGEYVMGAAIADFLVKYHPAFGGPSRRAAIIAFRVTLRVAVASMPGVYKMETDGVGKVTGNLPRPQDVPDRELDQAIDTLRGSIEQRELEGQNGPGGKPDPGHQERIDRERRLLQTLELRRYIRDN